MVEEKRTMPTTAATAKARKMTISARVWALEVSFDFMSGELLYSPFDVLYS